MKPSGKPAFVVQVATNYNGNGRLLQWDGVSPGPAACFPLWKVLGRYACYAIDAGASLKVAQEEAPRVILSLEVAKQLQSAFIDGWVREETMSALATAIRSCEDRTRHQPHEA